MPQARLYVPTLSSDARNIELDAERAHYLGRVLRMQPGSELTVFDGSGDEYEAVVASIRRNDARIKLKTRRTRSLESPLGVRLVQGVSRGERMDLVVQKATELGVRDIVPVMTERAVVRLDEERAKKRTAHWRKIAIGACEQCGRNVIPDVSEPTTLGRFLTGDSNAGLRIVLVPGAHDPLPAADFTGNLVELLIGPEGGLDEPEIGAATAAGFRPFSIGPRVLRSETAGIAALAAVQVLWGDLAG